VVLLPLHLLEEVPEEAQQEVFRVEEAVREEEEGEEEEELRDLFLLVSPSILPGHNEEPHHALVAVKEHSLCPFSFLCCPPRSNL